MPALYTTISFQSFGFSWPISFRSHCWFYWTGWNRFNCLDLTIFCSTFFAMSTNCWMNTMFLLKSFFYSKKGIENKCCTEYFNLFLCDTVLPRCFFSFYLSFSPSPVVEVSILNPFFSVEIPVIDLPALFVINLYSW